MYIMHRASTSAAVVKARAVNSQCDWANSAKRSSTSSDENAEGDSFVDETVGETTTSDPFASASSVAKAGCPQEDGEDEEPRRRRQEALARARRGATGARVVARVVALVRFDVAIESFVPDRDPDRDRD